MNILVIGGSRFVGPYVVESLAKRGHTVTVFNRGKIKSRYGKGVKFVRGDRNTGLKLRGHFDVVIDTIAYEGSQTKKAIEELDFGFFLHFGTGAAYRKSETFPLSEESPLGRWPAWGDYNKGKVECERVLKSSGVKYASIRPVYILGPKNYVERESFIYSRIKKGRQLVLPGNGEAIVQFVFAKDVAASIVTLAEKKLTGAFNCSGNETLTLNGLVSEMGRIVGKKPLIRYNPKADGADWDEDEFPFANENFFCRNEKLKALGIKFTPLIAGLKSDYNRYYKKAI